MEALLDSIRVALEDGASDDERQRGALACRALAGALDGSIVVAPAAPIALDLESAPAPAPSLTPATVAPAPTALATFLIGPVAPLAANPFTGLTADQILDLAIAKLRHAVGDDAPPPVGQPFHLTLVPVPRGPR